MKRSRYLRGFLLALIALSVRPNADQPLRAEQARAPHSRPVNRSLPEPAVRVRVKTEIVPQTLDPLRTPMRDIDDCYDQWLRFDPSLSGSLTARLTLNRERVTAVDFGDGGVGNFAFEGCVRSVLSELQSPVDGTVDLPLRFVTPLIPPPALRPALADLCRRIRNEALRPEYGRLSNGDLLHAVLTAIGQQTPEFRAYFESLLPNDVPPIQRRETFVRAISAGLGVRWQCPSFERLWEGQVSDL